MKHHSNRWAFGLLPVVLIGLALPGAGANASAPGNPLVALTDHLTRTANLLPGLANAIARGTAAPSTRLTVDFGLADPYAASESSLLSDLYNPSSAQYHQFLTPDQFDQRFHVPAAAVTATESWLKSGGLAVSYVSGTGDLISVQGTVAQFGSLLHTTFGNYHVGTINFIANQVAPSVPTGLPITDVVGLNTLERSWSEPELSANQLTKAVPTAPVAAANYTGTLVPQDLWDVYDAPATDQGQGEAAGMFGYGYTNGVIADLRVGEQRLGLPAVPVRVVTEAQVTNPPVATDNDVLGDDEWNLDTQAITGMAPKLSQLDMYFASTPLDADTVTMFSSWANDPAGPKQMDASFGECEADPTSGKIPQLPLTFGLSIGNEMQIEADHSLEQAVLEGRTLFTSAGDTGGSCPLVILPVLSAGNGVIPQPLPFDQGYPCVSAYAVCVGGTVVTTNGTSNPVAAGATAANKTTKPVRVAEQAWAYTGGGPAANVPRPAYQVGVSAIHLPCTALHQADGTAIALGTTCRGAPDVAAMSGSGLVDGEIVGANAFLANVDMMPAGVGGTSLSSPLVVGMWSAIQAAAPATAPGVYRGLGFANETFYAVGKGTLGNAAKDFFDVTSNELLIGNFYERAGSGWDYTTGWGAPDVSNFIRDIDHNPAMVPTHPSANAPTQSFFPAVACSATMTSPAGNAYDTTLSVTSLVNDTALDITSASLTPSADGNDLVATISGPGLSTTGPLDALDGFNFYVDWTYQGTTYFATAEVNPPLPLPKTPLTNSIPAPISLPTGSVTYGDGTISSVSPTIAHRDAGSFSNHTFTIDVPLSDVGSPPTGSLLLYPFAYDTLPVAIFVPFATDEATAPSPGVAIRLGSPC